MTGQATSRSRHGTRTGRLVRQAASASGQRGWNGQPGGGSIGLGTSPDIGWRSRLGCSTFGIVSSSTARRIEQADHRRAGQRLAGAGFADYAENLAGRDVEGYAVNGGERAMAGVEDHAQVADGEEGGHEGRKARLGSAQTRQGPSPWTLND